MPYVSNISHGKKILKPDSHIKGNKVESGSVVIADSADIRYVSSGGIVIANTITNLNHINSGGTVICQTINPTVSTNAGGIVITPNKSAISDTANTRIYTTFDSYINAIQDRLALVKNQATKYQLKHQIDKIMKYETQARNVLNK